MHIQSQLSSSAHRDLVPADEHNSLRDIPSLAWDHRHWWRQSSKDYPSDANHWSVGFDGVRDIFPCTTAALPTNLRSLSMGLRQSPPLLLELQVIVRERILYLLAYVTSSSLSMRLHQSSPLLLELKAFVRERILY